jgi:hypothetical protein
MKSTKMECTFLNLTLVQVINILYGTSSPFIEEYIITQLTQLTQLTSSPFNRNILSF